VITVVSWYWQQPDSPVQFSADNVNIWADMVRRHCTLDIELACVTDTPEGIDPSIRIIEPPGDFEDVELPTWGKAKPQCLRRIALFRPDAADIFGERFLSMDLDCAIGGSIDHIVGAPEDFRITQGTALRRPFNGSLVLMTAGCRSQVYELFTPERAVEAGQHYLGSDQAWIAAVLGDEATFTPTHGVVMGRSAAPARIRFYNGQWKPWDAVREATCSYAVEHYRAAPQGRAVYLGSGATVWDDAAQATRERFDAVFACPEAAQHWSATPIKALARDEAQAQRLAGMYGYELAVCGANERRAG
jgi:hypothetical protein